MALEVQFPIESIASACFRSDYPTMTIITPLPQTLETMSGIKLWTGIKPQFVRERAREPKHSRRDNARMNSVNQTYKKKSCGKWIAGEPEIKWDELLLLHNWTERKKHNNLIRRRNKRKWLIDWKKKTPRFDWKNPTVLTEQVQSDNTIVSPALK